MIALPEYFIIKIAKKTQKDNKEKIGTLYLAPSHVAGERGLQCGEIISIGEYAHKALPQAEIGDLLIIHWMVEFFEKGDPSRSFIEEDEDFNYYNVTASDYNGRRNETYGVFKNGEITPHKDFVFIKQKGEIYNEVTTNSTGLFVFKNWNESREAISQKSSALKQEIESLSKSTMTDQVKKAIEEKEQESRKNATKLNAKRYSQFIVDFANPESEIKNGDTVYVLNLAAETTVTFQNKEYIVANKKYVAAIL